MRGIGTDIIEVARIRANLEKYGEKFLEKILSERERDYSKTYKDQAPLSAHIAGRFAAKEAVVKALGKGFGDELGFHDVEILNDLSGKPQVILSQRSQTIFDHPQFWISISHCKSHAVAMVVCH
jgi:holo-[acyl-carrier protein] synthase